MMDVDWDDVLPLPAADDGGGMPADAVAAGEAIVAVAPVGDGPWVEAPHVSKRLNELKRKRIRCATNFDGLALERAKVLLGASWRASTKLCPAQIPWTMPGSRDLIAPCSCCATRV